MQKEMSLGGGGGYETAWEERADFEGWRKGAKRKEGPERRGTEAEEGGRGAVTRAGADEFIYKVWSGHYISQLKSAMSKSLLVLLLLGVAVYSYQTCLNCKPAVKIQNCYQPQCYRCGYNEVFNPDTLYCDCLPGYVPINGQCGKCRDGYQYDSVMQQCIGVNPCGINQYLVNGSCKCLPGLIVIQNICQRCPTNMTYYQEFDACRCTIGYTSLNGNCVYIECGLNEVYSVDSQKCVCAFGYYLISGSCSQCAIDKVYNLVNQSCDPFITPTCGVHEYFFESCCFCERGYVKIDGICGICPKHSSYDWNTDSCVCDAGYYFVGETVKQVPYQYYDTGSSFNNNPGYTYSYKAPYSSTPYEQPIIVIGSNYDSSSVNTNKPNINNVYTVPPIYRRR